ncbi:hypothetical protein DF3PA_470004 [Candidatus Defluviicoccus seviourii]|uniref:Lipoprotein n=1 Tax=Candidatus Defluviicoccus seviourii TaxID=2565273 RepID=A0A564WGB7_9PROT|nr:hypothetical protein DF3PA_470004 [Candidatus Defluviicoccus seviourii]
MLGFRHVAGVLGLALASCSGVDELNYFYPDNTVIDKGVVTETKRVSLAKTLYVAPNGKVLCEEDIDSMTCVPYILARHGKKDLDSARLVEVDSGQFKDELRKNYYVLVEAPNRTKTRIWVDKGTHDAVAIGQKLGKQQ